MIRLRTMLAAAIVCLAALSMATAAEPRPGTADTSEKRSAGYREGQKALERQDWGEASRLFGKLAAQTNDETDAALYWKAYADWKQQKKKESLGGLKQLLAAYPRSAWANDARTLEAEIRGGKGGSGSTESEDEELKLYALDGLMQIESDKAVPVLEKLLAGDSSPRIKQRALFVLSQSDSPRAREILLRTAKTGQPVALRCEAVKTLGIAGEPEDIAALGTIARDTGAPAEVRAAVIDAFMIADRSDELASIARSDPDPALRSKAIDALGASNALPALRQLWSTEKDPDLRAKLLDAFGIAGDVETLAKAARESTDPALRRKAIEGLGIADDPAAGKLLKQLYVEFPGVEDKRKVVEAFMIRDDAKTLIEMFRVEKDPAMKKIILQQLSVMDDPEATRTILDVLGGQP